MDNKDVIGIAQTGTGKTLAFGLPMIQHVLGEAQGVGLIVAPTRELALQIAETLTSVGKPLGLRTATLIGGAPMNKQLHSLRARPHILICTPGRLEDHLQQKTVSLHQVTMVVLDEADRMFDMGFAPAIKRIFEAIPKDRQTLLFTATLPREIEVLATSYLREPVKVEIASQGRTADLVSQELIVADMTAKPQILEQLLQINKGTILVFARTRHGARKIAKSIRDMGHTAAELHADRTLAQRKAALEGFKRGEFRVLVATDIASRGIDVKSITLVINYDLPDQIEDYVHRIGRTGRAGETGRSITIATPQQTRDVQDIEKLIQQEIPLSPQSPMSLHRFQPRSNNGQRTPFAGKSSSASKRPWTPPHQRRPAPAGSSSSSGGGRRFPSSSSR